MQFDLFGSLTELFLKAWVTWQLKMILSLLAMAVLCRMAAELRGKTFTLRRAADFITDYLAPYTLVFVAAQSFGEASGLTWAPSAVTAFVSAKLGAMAINALSDLGVPVPDFVLQLTGGGRIPVRVIDQTS
jgi:hypothetical protein